METTQEQNQIAPADMVNRLRSEPLLFAQTVIFNNPDAVSNGLRSTGAIQSQPDDDELIDIVLDAASRLSPDDLYQLFDVPFDFNDGPASGPGYFAVYENARQKTGMDDSEATWAALFPDAAKSVGSAQADFSGQEYQPESADAEKAAAQKPKGKCLPCSLRRLKNLSQILTLVAVVLLVLLIIKKW